MYTCMYTCVYIYIYIYTHLSVDGARDPVTLFRGQHHERGLLWRSMGSRHKNGVIFSTKGFHIFVRQPHDIMQRTGHSSHRFRVEVTHLFSAKLAQAALKKRAPCRKLVQTWGRTALKKRAPCRKLVRSWRRTALKKPSALITIINIINNPHHITIISITIIKDHYIM